MKTFFRVEKIADDCKARAGFLKLNGIEIPTPVFMPVGTYGTVKAMLPSSLYELDYKLILGNTYHLYLRPGLDVIKHFEGLHNFINWKNCILTDSGGYQVFSLQSFRKLSEEGVEFSSHIDGSKHFFTPESVVQHQRVLGSDIMMILDDCVEYPADYGRVEESVERTYNWAVRSLKEFANSEPLWGRKQFIFGIVQGGTFPDLRRRSLGGLLSLQFDGYAIGGLSVGEPEEKMYEITSLCTDLLPIDKPRYLMGVGTPQNILECIELGVDMFDCVLPTRNGRNGQIFTTRGKINIRNAKYKFSKEPIDPGLNNEISQNFTIGYLRHLFIADEILGLQLATYQNLAFYKWLVATAREKILSGLFRYWKNNLILNFKEN
ncbi:MAG: Queuine tRNA-ribosyltransferase [Candidatus Kapaibacterium sp.]|jgi:queuine tRNA-ribosyltransferase|nr:MAG: Queuine tRNA-ribosyltransferase [Candidatus Kapabacteria bacterium]ROL57280.1 MAG: tRNA guanosine(34) transglycosylase Tgt [Bacteroidetes/Chlorobi group bacterium Naka2016]